MPFVLWPRCDRMKAYLPVQFFTASILEKYHMAIPVLFFERKYLYRPDHSLELSVFGGRTTQNTTYTPIPGPSCLLSGYPTLPLGGSWYVYELSNALQISTGFWCSSYLHWSVCSFFSQVHVGRNHMGVY